MNPSRPSGPGWEAYKRTELEYIKQHGKGSGKYYNHGGQRWRLDRKAEAGKPVRYSPKSVDVKNKENTKKTSARQQKIDRQTAATANAELAQNKRAHINGRGHDVHHTTPIDRVEKGLVQKYGGRIPDHVRKAFNQVGVFFGDDPRNLSSANKPTHRSIHSQHHKLDASLQKLEQAAERTRNARHFVLPGAFTNSESGSDIVDRVNNNMRLTGYAGTLGVPLDLF